MSNENHRPASPYLIPLSIISLAALLGSFFLPSFGPRNTLAYSRTSLGIGHSIGLILIVLAMAVMSYSPNRKMVGLSGVLSLIGFLWWAPVVVGGLIEVAKHNQSVNSGGFLAIAGVLFLLTYFVFTASTGLIGWKISKSRLRTSMVGGTIALAWAAGEFMPWIRTTYVANHQSMIRDCCVIFKTSANGSMPLGYSFTYLLLILLIVVAVFLVSFVKSKTTGGLGLIAIAVAFSGEIINGLQTVANANPMLAGQGAGQMPWSNQPNMTVSPLPGLWLNLIAELALLGYGIYVFIDSRIEE